MIIANTVAACRGSFVLAQLPEFTAQFVCGTYCHKWDLYVRLAIDVTFNGLHQRSPNPEPRTVQPRGSQLILLLLYLFRYLKMFYLNNNSRIISRLYPSIS